MAVDLHTHSVVSDGSETPTEVVRLAAAAGLSAIALTDHDILAGLTEAKDAAHRHSVELVPGIELSLDWSDMVPGADERGGMHLLVLWLDDESGPLQDRLGELRRGRDERNRTVLEKLSRLGMDIPWEAVLERARTGSVGRPHIAAEMVDRGYATDISAAFDLYLGQGKPAYVARRRLTPPEAIDLGRQSGGVPVLAHPHTLRYEDDDPGLEKLLGRLADLGLVGVESHHSGASPERRRILRKMLKRVDLLPSGGSDFHGTYKPGIEIGSGCGDLVVPDEFLDALRERRSARQ